MSPAIFSQMNSSMNSKDFDIKYVTITVSESILILRWIITTFQKVVWFEQFLWAWYNIFASFFLADVMFRTCSFVCVCWFCRITSFEGFLRLFILNPEPRIHWKSAAGKQRWSPKMSIGLHLGWTGSGLVTNFAEFGLDPYLKLPQNLGLGPDLDWVNGKELRDFCGWKALFCSFFGLFLDFDFKCFKPFGLLFYLDWVTKIQDWTRIAKYECPLISGDHEALVLEWNSEGVCDFCQSRSRNRSQIFEWNPHPEQEWEF